VTAEGAREYFDLIVVDEKARGGSGLDACRALKVRAPSTPVLLCTGDPFEPRPEQAKAAGAQALLVHEGDLDKMMGVRAPPDRRRRWGRVSLYRALSRATR
jgi:CheY-like chemotaxis protein